MKPVELTSDQLLLSVPTIADVDELTHCCQDPAIQRWTTVPSPYRRADAERFLLEQVGPGWEAGTELSWGIRRAHDEELVGVIDLHGVRARIAVVGYWLRAEARRSGFMSEAVRLVCDYGFAPYGAALRQIQWRAYIGNVASARVARRAGFRYEGINVARDPEADARRYEWCASLLPEGFRDALNGNLSQSWPDQVISR